MPLQNHCQTWGRIGQSAGSCDPVRLAVALIFRLRGKYSEHSESLERNHAARFYSVE
jgi:hypothetical protein